MDCGLNLIDFLIEPADFGMMKPQRIGERYRSQKKLEMQKSPENG